MAIGIPILNDVVGGDQSLTIEWSEVANASEYRIKFGTAPGDHSTTKVVLVSELSVPTEPNFILNIDSGVVIENDTTYWVIVTAYSSALLEESAISNELYSVAKAGADVLAQPQNFSVKSGAGLAELYWDAPMVEPDSYLIEYTDSLDAPITWQTQTVMSPATTATITKLTNDTPYYFRISSVQGENASVATEPEIGIPQAGIITPVEGKYVKMTKAEGNRLFNVLLRPNVQTADAVSMAQFLQGSTVSWKALGATNWRTRILAFGTANKSLEPMEAIYINTTADKTKYLSGSIWTTVE
jgi:hypothetical protein